MNNMINLEKFAGGALAEKFNVGLMDETLRMITELEKRGYKVIKISKAMEKDMEECEEMDLEGKSKDCFSCSCSICLMETY